MGGTRIMVFQLKELIKTGIFALLGLVLIIALIIFLLPDKSKDAAAGGYVPGTYTAQIILHSKPVDIAVTVSDKEITNIQLMNMQAEQEVFYPLFKPTLDDLTKEIIRYQTTQIATSKDTAVTSQILLDAVNAALQQAVPKSASTL